MKRPLLSPSHQPSASAGRRPFGKAMLPAMRALLALLLVAALAVPAYSTWTDKDWLPKSPTIWDIGTDILFEPDTANLTDGALVGPGTEHDLSLTASDSDFYVQYWTGQWNGLDEIHGEEDDTVTYTWTCSGGSITGTGGTATWEAPNEQGLYTITCTLSDTATPGSGETGSRADDDVEYSIDVYVDGKTWSPLAAGYSDFSNSASVMSTDGTLDGASVIPGTGVSLSAYALDYDTWTQLDSSTDVVADEVTFSWSADGGTFLNGIVDSYGATWVAPTTPGTYTVTCTFDDEASDVGPFDLGSRDDEATEREFVIVVPSRFWGANNGILNSNGQSPEIVSPVAPTSGLYTVAVGDTVALEVEEGIDTDEWTQLTNSGSDTDTVTYLWTVKDESGAAVGSFSGGATARTASWVAPTTPGTYTVKCKLEDIPTEVEEPDTGDRNDCAYRVSFQITVAQVDHLKYTIDPNAGPQNVPTGTLYVALGTTLAFEAATDHNFPEGKPVWGGTAGITAEGATDPAKPLPKTFNAAGTFTVTASCGNQKSVTISVVGVEFSAPTAVVKKSNQIVFTATVDPVSALSQVSFVSEDTGTATITNTGTVAGTKTFTLQGVEIGSTHIKAKLGAGETATTLADMGVWVNTTGLGSNEIVVDPTVQIRDSGATTYLADKVASSQVPVPGTAAIFYARVTNDNITEFLDGDETYKVTGPAGADGWTISYADVANEQDITAAVTSTNGWTTPQLTESSNTNGIHTHEIAIAVIPPVNVAATTPCEVDLTFTSSQDPNVSVTVTATTTPLIAPLNFRVDPEHQDRMVTVKWNLSAGADEYRVYRHNDTEEEVTAEDFTEEHFIAKTSYNFWEDKYRKNNAKYFYIVRAVNAVGDIGPPSAVKNDTTLALPAPVNLTGTPGDKHVVLNWDAASTDAAEDTTYYRIYRSTTATGVYSLIASTPPAEENEPPVTKFTNSSLINGLKFFYKVVAWNSGGESLPTAASDEMEPEGDPPAAPGSLVATGGDRQVLLEWDAVEGALKYFVYRSNVVDGTYTKVADASAQTAEPAYIDGNLTNNTTYFYKVTAVDGMPQEGDASGTANATTDQLAAPTGLTAEAGIREVRLEWEEVEGADAYQIYRSTTTGGTYTLLRRLLEHEFVDAGMPGDDDYYYVVRAWNNGGVGEQSTEATAHPTFPIVDAMIATADATDFTGYATYNTDALNQAVAQNTGIGVAAVYTVRVQNQVSAATTFKITAPQDSNGWTLKFYDGEVRDTEHDITDEVTGAGWETPTVNGAAYREIAIEVIPGTTVADTAQQVLLLTATQVGHTENTDTVKATTTRVRQVGALEYKLAPGDDWDEYPADGLTVPLGAQLYFRATLNPAGETFPTNKPEWQHNDEAVGTGAEPAGMTFTTIGSHIVSATCDNTLTATVNVVGVAHLQCSEDGETYYDVPETNLQVAQGTTLKFRAIAEGGGWPAGQPEWSGETGTTDTGDGAIRSVEFATLSTSGTDFKIVTATCGTSSVTANLVVVAQLDIGIRNLGAASFNTSSAQSVIPNVRPATYEARIKNSTTDTQSYTLTGTEGDEGWTVSYFDDSLIEANRNISTAITDAEGSNLILSANQERIIRIVVTPALSVAEDATLPVTLTVTSAATPLLHDNVVATTTRWKQLDYMEYSLDGGQTWEALDVGYDAAHPLTVEAQVVVGLRATKKHEAVSWPSVLYPEMGYPRWNNAGEEHSGDHIWVSWQRADTGAHSVSVACGDSISIYVNVVAD